MKVVVQRVLNASVSIDDKVVGKCNKGYMLLVGFTDGDNDVIIRKMADKIVNLRVFDDENGKMNYSLLKIGGEILSISQFTLYANAKEGRRPSFIDAMNPVEATKCYDFFNECLRGYDVHVETGVFGADMQVSLINDGPITIILDSKEIF